MYLLPTSNVQRHISAPLVTFQFPLRRFDQINVDRTGLLPPSSRCTHLMTMLNLFTRWPEAIPFLDTIVPTCARALVTHWISRFGVPMKCRLTCGHSLHHRFGHPFHSCWAPSSITPHPTTLSPMVSVNL